MASMFCYLAKQKLKGQKLKVKSRAWNLDLVSKIAESGKHSLCAALAGLPMCSREGRRPKKGRNFLFSWHAF
jgi:hypothetical protein